MASQSDSIDLQRGALGGFARDFDALQEKAAKWWPEDVVQAAADLSIIPMLQASKDKFVSILKLGNEHPEHVFEILEATDFPANLFLKHMQLLSDFGGEAMQRLNGNFHSVFLRGAKEKPFMRSYFLGDQFRYEFAELPVSGTLTNVRLSIDGKGLKKNITLSPLLKDMVMILLHGSNAENGEGAILDKCEIGNYLNDSDALEKFIATDISGLVESLLDR